MEALDYSVVFQDYLDEAERLRVDLLKAYARIKENSAEVEKLCARAELREQTIANHYESYGYVMAYPQEAVPVSKIEKELKTAMIKCEDSQSRLYQLKRSFEFRIKRMEQESLTWNPSTRRISEHNLSKDDSPLPFSPNGTPTNGEKRKSHSGALNVSALPKNCFRVSGRFVKKIKHKAPQEVKGTTRVVEKEEDAIQWDAEEVEDDNRLYCICRRESFGEMIACDNTSCPIEWFHLECFGLSEAPSGNWFCSVCSGKAPSN